MCQIILLIFIVFYLTLRLLSWKNSILSCTLVFCKPPRNTKKNKGPAFVLNNSIFLYGVEVTKLSSTITDHFHCPCVQALRDCLKCIQGQGECMVQPSVLNKEQQKNTHSYPTCSRASIQTKQVQARKSARSQGRRIKIRFFGYAQYKGRTMLFVTELLWMIDLARQLFIKIYEDTGPVNKNPPPPEIPYTTLRERVHKSSAIVSVQTIESHLPSKNY